MAIGKTAILLAMESPEDNKKTYEKALKEGYKVVLGRVGSMELGKIVAAIETAVKREKLLEPTYRSEHAVYHAVLEAFHGVCRGQLELGNIMRTVGLNFAVVCGPRGEGLKDDGHWVAVALYGTIGAPIKGWEHETIGLGINHF